MIVGLPYPQPQQLALVSRSARVLAIEAAPSAADLHAWQRQSTQASLAGFVVQGRVLQVTPDFYDVLGATPRTPFWFLGHRIERMQTPRRETGKGWRSRPAE